MPKNMENNTALFHSMSKNVYKNDNYYTKTMQEHTNARF